MLLPSRNDEWWLRFWSGIYLYATIAVTGCGIVAIVATKLMQVYSERVGDVQKLEIARLNARAAEAELALATIRTPRRLSERQEGAIFAQLVHTRNVPFVMYVVSGDPEGYEYMDQIRDLLIKCSWTQRPSRDTIRIGIAGTATSTGLMLSVESAAKPHIFGIAKSLAAFLAKQGIQCDQEVHVSSERRDEEAIHIYVGKKPL